MVSAGRGFSAGGEVASVGGEMLGGITSGGETDSELAAGGEAGAEVTTGAGEAGAGGLELQPANENSAPQSARIWRSTA
jgi:hypothetical protein